MLNNPKYSNPPVDLAIYKAGIDQFSALIVDAEDGGKKAISAKDKKRIEVTKFSWIDRGPNSGDVVGLPESQTGAIAFDVRYALQGAGGVLGPWTVVTAVKPRKVTITGLTLAGIYQFQIRALGVLGYTDWMDPKTFVVA